MSVPLPLLPTLAGVAGRQTMIPSTLLRSFFTFFTVLAPAIAQVVQTSASCPWSTGTIGSGLIQVNASLAVSGTPAAGASLQFSSNLQMTTSAPYLSSMLYVMAIGVSDPGLPLSSCGCTLRTSLDWLDAQSLLISTQGASWGLPHFFGAAQAAPFALNIPPGISNVVLHAQGFSWARAHRPARSSASPSRQRRATGSPFRSWRRNPLSAGLVRRQPRARVCQG